MDDLELIAAAEYAERQGARGVDQLARHVEGHEADDLAAGHGCLPLARVDEVEIVEQILATRDDFGGGRHG